MQISVLNFEPCENISAIFVKKWKVYKYFSEGFLFDTNVHWVLNAPKWDSKFLLEPLSNSCVMINAFCRKMNSVAIGMVVG